MACAYGNYFVTTEGRLDLPLVVVEKEKKMLLNDNRLSAGLSENWHPPEGGSLHIS
jgi:hypothetical protein